jgi:hypothetical protein
VGSSGVSSYWIPSFAFQTAFAAYSVPKQTDKFYDLAGSLGFISTTLLSLVSEGFRQMKVPVESTEPGMSGREADIVISVLSRCTITLHFRPSNPIPTI